MADDVVQLDFQTNIGNVVAEISRALQQVQRDMEAAGRASSNGQVGQSFTDGLARMASEAQSLTNVVQQNVVKIREGLASLSDLQGPKTLGGQFGQIIGDLTKASDLYLRTLDGFSRNQAGSSSNLRESLVAPIQQTIEQMKAIEASARAALTGLSGAAGASLEQFLNPAQITRATNVGQNYVNQITATDPRGSYVNQLPAFDPVVVALLKAATDGSSSGNGKGDPATNLEVISAAHEAQEKATAKRTQAADKAAEADSQYAQETRNLITYIDQVIRAGLAKRFGDFVQVDEPNGQGPFGSDRRRYYSPETVPPPLGIAPDLGATDQQADAARVSELQRAAEADAEKDAIEKQRQSLALTAKRQKIGRNWNAALDVEDQIAQRARYDAFRAGDPTYKQIGAAADLNQLTPKFFSNTTNGALAMLTQHGITDELNPKQFEAGMAELAREKSFTASQGDRAEAQQRLRQTEKDRAANLETFYSMLNANNPRLQNIEQANPGYRDLGGGYLQSATQLLRANGDELKSQQDLYSARTRLAGVLERNARQAQQQGGGGARPGTIFDSFLGGAFGHGFDSHQAFNPKEALANLAATGGVLARYGYEFKIIQSAIDAVSTSFKDFVALQDTLVDFDAVAEAAGGGAVDMSQAFTTAAGTAVDANTAYQIGTQALAAYHDEIAAGTSANTIFQRSVEAVGTAMLVTGQSAQQSQKDILASTNGFQIGSAGGTRINDAVVNAFHNYGGDKGQIYDAVAASASSAKEAGLDPEFLANMVALISSRTGSSGSTISTTLDRLVNRQSNSTFRQALSQTGIQDTGNLQQEIPQLSAAYQKMTQAQQEAFTSALGGARSMQDLLPILQSGTSLTDAYAKSQHGSGAAADEAQKHLDSLAGQLKQLSTLFKDIETQIGGSGIFTGLEVALAAVKPAMQAVNDLLVEMNTVLPGPAKFVLGLAADFLILAKVIDVMLAKFTVSKLTEGIGGLASKLGVKTAATATATTEVESSSLVQAAQDRLNAAKARGVQLDEAMLNESGARVAAAQAEADALLVQAAAQERLDVAEAGGFRGGFRRGNAIFRGAPGGAAVSEGEAAAGGGLAATLGTGAGALTRLIFNPVTAVIGALAVGGATYEALSRFHEATNKGTVAMNDIAKANTADQLKQAGSEFGDAADATKRASSGFFDSIVNGIGGKSSNQLKQDKRYQAFANNEAQQFADSQTSDVGNLANTAFGPGSSLVQGLQSMKDNGIDASTQLHALDIALGLVKKSAGDAASALVNLGTETPKGPTATPQNVQALAKTVLGASVTYATTDNFGDQAGANNVTGSTTIKPDLLDANKAIQAQLKADGIGSSDEIPASEVPALVKAVMGTIDWTKVKDKYGFKHDVPPAVKEKIAAELVAGFQTGLQGLTAEQIAQQTSPLNNDALGSFLDAVLPQQQADLQEADPKHFGLDTGKNGKLTLNKDTKLDDLRKHVDELKAGLARSTDPSGSNYAKGLKDLAQAEDAYATEKISEIEQIRQASEGAAGSNTKKIGQIRKDLFNTEIHAAGDSVTAMVSVLDNMTQGEINLQKTVLDGAVKLKAAAVRNAQAAYDAIIHSPAEHDPDMRGAIEKAKAALDAALAALGSASTASSTFNAAEKSGHVTPAAPGSDAAAQAAEATKEAKLAAAANPGDPVSQAQAALNVAQAQLKFHSAKKDADYWNAVKAVKDAQYQYAQAVEQNAIAAANSKVFPGSKLEAAANAIFNAKEELKVATRNTADWHKAQGDMLKAQVDYAAAVLEYQHNQRLLKIDITNPVAMAAEQVREDAQQLRNDKKLGGPKAKDVIAADEVKSKQDQAALQNAKFSQKMQDEKTAYDLQQISATQYIQFLEDQSKTFHAMKHRTQQQIDEMNQVDEALKAATDQMQGQFNIGNIKVPTPYEVRRAIATDATSSSANYQNNATSNVTINVSSAQQFADLLDKYIGQYFGTATLSRAGTTTTRVR